VRFDIVEVLLEASAVREIRHLPNTEMQKPYRYGYRLKGVRPLKDRLRAISFQTICNGMGWSWSKFSARCKNQL
jgi:hypothetical protein